LWNWVRAEREAAERDADPEALSESERDVLKRLRKQTAQQEIDLEILRKAAAYFARETRR
jgi:transposase